jgi:lysophospholipase L1-like esterase
MDFVDLYGQAISAAAGEPVVVDNRDAIEFSALPAVQATQLLNDILSDESLRSAIAGADIVLMNVGFNDTPWNRVDNPCDASNADATVVQWSKITADCISRVTHDYKQTLDEIVTQVDELRGCFIPPGQPRYFCTRFGGKTTVLRLVTVYDDWIGEPGTPAAALVPTEAGDASFVAGQCWIIEAHGGKCADIYHVFNGAKGTADAAPFLVDDHTHLSQLGHQRVAQALAKLGFDPLLATTP